ncbi:MAG: hypothetical protein Tsb0013_08860 [Phycisphaerales bacterium]
MPTRTALLGLASILTLAGAALAENEMRLIDEDRALYRASFEGGTLTEFVGMLREGLDGRAMFITPERGDEISMPAFDITNVEFIHVVALSHAIAGVPSMVVEGDDWSGTYETGEGVPVITFDTSRVLMPQGVEPRITSLDYPGGTIASYVEALKDAGASGRVVITGDPGDLTMQPATLKNVSVSAAVFMLDGIETSDGQTVRRVEVEELGGLYRVHVESRTRGSGGEPASRVWSLRGMTVRGMDSDALLGAIETGLEALAPERQPTLRYHEPTSLLIAVGDATSLGLIESIIRGLDESASVGARTLSGEERMKQYRARMERHLERLENDREVLTNNAEVARVRAERIARLVEAAETEEERERLMLEADPDELLMRSRDYERRAEEIAFRIDGVRTRLGQLDRMMKLVEQEYLPTPTESMLEQEFGIPND